MFVSPSSAAEMHDRESEIRLRAHNQSLRIQHAKHVLVGFIVLVICCQLVLLVPALAKLRVVFRTASFVMSLAALLMVRGKSHPHPAALWALLTMMILMVELVHPQADSWLAALAQIALNLAILGPIFWVPRLSVTPSVLFCVIQLLWLFHSLSAGLGVLQIHFPGQFQPPLSDIVAKTPLMKEAAMITLANGEHTFRPMGLTDCPGGAATSGIYAVTFGLGFFLSSRSWSIRSLAAASIVAGLFCVYVSQIRSILVMCGISTVALAALLARRGDAGRLTGLAILIPVVAVASFLWAAKIGGEATVKRMQTLTSDSPGQVYYKNRGFFVENTLNVLLPQFPLGAGLGHWGMTNVYFGEKIDAATRRFFHVEVQLTGWLLDGGVPLIVTYSLAIFTALATAYRIAVTAPPGGALAVWASIVLAYDIGAVAVTFNYPLFISQGGMEFWLLNAALFGAALSTRRATHSQIVEAAVVS